ncbi:MAG: tetratricopeptide repeat protein [Tepidamorphaceae bacterium]
MLAASLGATAASAQSHKSDSRLGDKSSQAQLPADLSGEVDGKEAREPASKVDAMLDALAEASDPDTATRLEQSLLQAWLNSGSSTIDLLMNRAVIAMDAKQYPLALEILDSVIEMKPSYAEGWNKRATLYYLIDDYGRSMRDIQMVLSLEPRHFGALSGLGLILQEVGQKAGALAAFRQALSVHPFLGNLQENVEELAHEVEGDAI